MDKNNQNMTKETSIGVNLDTTPIFYTDNIFMSTNKFGLILDICQRLASTNNLRIVSRIGMSREHAKRFLTELGNLLAMTEGQSQTNTSKNN